MNQNIFILSFFFTGTSKQYNYDLYTLSLRGAKFLMYVFHFIVISCNEPPEFSNDLNNLVLLENTPVGSVIGTLKGADKEGSLVHYGIEGTDLLSVDRDTGDVRLVKALDREVSRLQINT